MQATARSTETTPPAPPAPRREYLRTRRAVVREAEQLESVEQLAIAFQTGRRSPWALTPCAKVWKSPEWPVSVRLLLAFLGAVLEGSVRPRWVKGGLIAIDAITRTVIGSIEDRDFAAGNKLIPGDWANLLRSSSRQARRCIHLAVELGLVEQIRNRQPGRGVLCEVAAAYVPTRKLLDWLLERRPPADLLPSETDKMSDPQKSSPLLRGEEDLLKSADPSGAGQEGQLVPDELAELVGEEPSEAAFGTVAVGRASAPVGDERPAEGPQLLVAGVSARPAAPPAERPPGDFVDRAEVAALARTLVGQLDLPRVGSAQPPDELEQRRRAMKAQLERIGRRVAEDPPPTDGPGGGGSS